MTPQEAQTITDALDRLLALVEAALAKPQQPERAIVSPG